MTRGTGLRAVVFAVFVAHLGACHLEPVPAPAAATLLMEAIAAHGGSDSLARLDDLHVTSEVTFVRGGLVVERTLDVLAPESVAMRVDHDAVPILSFGLSGETCWRTDRAFVRDCSAEDVHDQQRVRDVLRARWLHDLDPLTVRDAEAVDIDGRATPALLSGDLRLAFDPDTHLLIQIDYEEDGALWSERYSAFAEHGGALVATERTLTIDGVTDTTDRWTAIDVGASDRERLTPRRASASGEVYDGEDPTRAVVWTDVLPPDATVTHADRVAEATATIVSALAPEDVGLSGTDGPILEPATALGPERLTLTLEVGRSFDGGAGTAVHADRWPAGRFVGIFHRGAVPPGLGAALQSEVNARGLSVSPGHAPQLVLSPDAEGEPESDALGLYRVRVVPAS